MWSVWHVLFMLSPIIILGVLYLCLRKASYKVRYIVGVVIGCISLAILIVRNIDVYNRLGLVPDLIPLQICHLGNIFVFISLLTRSKIMTSITYSFNVVCAVLSLVFADFLETVPTVFAIRPQTYIWGHIFIVVGGLYPVLFKLVRLDFKSFLKGYFCIYLFVIPAIILNSYFNDVLNMECNYFYLYDYHGVPTKFIYDLVPRLKIGWFTVDWLYVLILVITFSAFIFLIYSSQYLLYLKPESKEYKTYNIFEERKLKRTDN